MKDNLTFTVHDRCVQCDTSPRARKGLVPKDALGNTDTSVPYEMSLSVALEAVNNLLAERNCPFKALSDTQSPVEKLLHPKSMSMSRGESLLAELMYLRVESQSLRQKNRKLKRRLFNSLLPCPKKTGQKMTPLRPLSDVPSKVHLPPTPPAPIDLSLPPLRLKQSVGPSGGNVLPSVTTMLGNVPLACVTKKKPGCKNSKSPRSSRLYRLPFPEHE